MLERLVVALLFVTVLIVPAIRRESFPLSSTPMFAWPFRSYYSWELFNARGVRLDENVYRLRTNPNFYLESDYAVKYEVSRTHPPDQMPDLPNLIQAITAVGMQESEQFPLKLVGYRCYVSDDGTARRDAEIEIPIPIRIK